MEKDRLAICDKADRCKDGTCHHKKPHKPEIDGYSDEENRDTYCDEVTIKCGTRGQVICKLTYEYDLRKEFSEYLDGVFKELI